MVAVDIVIVNYRSAEFLEECLRSIYRNAHGIEIGIFVEDNSCEQEMDLIKTQFRKIFLSKNRTNLGFAKAVNRGIEKGNAPYVLILNPDTVLLDGFFESVIPYMENNPEVGVLGPKILNVDGTIQGSARSFPTPLTAFFGRSSLLTRLFPQNRFTRQNLLTIASDGTRLMEVDWVSGACMLVRRKAIDEVGYLDERFFMYWEDADWCRRMKEAGWRVVYFPSASIVHYGGVSSSRDCFRSNFEFHKSSYKLYAKYSANLQSSFKPVVIFGVTMRLVITTGLVLLRTLRFHNVKRTYKTDLQKRRKPDKKIKILTVISRLNIGGPSIHVAMVTKGLDRGQFEPLLVAGSPSATEGDMCYLFEDWDKRILYIPSMQREINFKRDILSLIILYRIMKRFRPEILDTHTAKAGFLGRVAAVIYEFISGRKIIKVHTFHGNIFSGYFGRWKSLFYVWIERWLARITDTVVAISPAQKDELVNTYGIAPAEKVRTVRLGLELDQFDNVARLRTSFRERFSIPQEAFLIGIIGRLVPIKNHLMLLKSAKYLSRLKQELGIHIAIVGDGELRKELEDYCIREGLKAEVTFCGWVRDVRAVYADLDALVLCSINEGTPVSIIEAMASKVPVISTLVGGIQDLVGSPRKGLKVGSFQVCSRGIICNKNDPLSLARAIEYLINEENEPKRNRIEKAFEFVSEKYSKSRLVSEIQSLYWDLFKKRGPLYHSPHLQQGYLDSQKSLINFNSNAKNFPKSSVSSATFS